MQRAVYIYPQRTLRCRELCIYIPTEDFEVQRAVYIYPQRTLRCRELCIYTHRGL